MSRHRRRTVGGAVLAIGAALVAVGSYRARIGELDAEIGRTVSVLRLRHPVMADHGPADDDVESVMMPGRWVPPGALSALGEVEGLVAGTDLPAGTVLTAGLLLSRPDVSSGERRSVVLLDRAALPDGVAPGARVDVIASFDSSVVGVARSEIVVPGARVLAVGDDTLGRSTPDHDDEAGVGLGEDVTSGRLDEPVPVAFALDPAAVLRLAFAESFASTVRVAFISPLARATPIVPSYSPVPGITP